MSEAQVKATPSKAASQGAVTLAMELIKEPHIEKWAALIDAKLADLLGKADKVLLLTHEHISPTLAKELLLELHRWKPK